MEPSDSAHPLEAALEVVLQDLHHAEREMALVSFRVHHAREAATSLQALVGSARAAEIAKKVGIPLPLRRVQGGGNMPAAARRALERRTAVDAEAANAGTANAERVARNRALQEAEREIRLPEEQRERGQTLARGDVRDSPPASDAVETTKIADGVYQIEDDVSSTDRVVQLLKEYEGQAIPRSMILDQFDKRGWVDPTWSHPGAAIRMAIRRAAEKGAAKQVDEGRYTYADPGLLGDLPNGGDAQR